MSKWSLPNVAVCFPLLRISVPNIFCAEDAELLFTCPVLRMWGWVFSFQRYTLLLLCFILFNYWKGCLFSSLESECLGGKDRILLMGVHAWLLIQQSVQGGSEVIVIKHAHVHTHMIRKGRCWNLNKLDRIWGFLPCIILFRGHPRPLACAQVPMLHFPFSITYKLPV